MDSSRSVHVHDAKWSVDQIVINNSSVFIFGWFFVPGYNVERLALILRDSLGEIVGSITLESSKARHDVYGAFHDVAESLESGFVGAGTWPRRPCKSDHLVLSANLSNGDPVFIEIQPDVWHSALEPTSWQQQQAGLNQWLYYALRAISLLKAGQLAILKEKVSRHFTGLTEKSLPASLTSSRLCDLKQVVAGDFHFIVDHQLGGGANYYRQQQVERLLDQGHAVLVLTYYLAKLQPILTVQTNKQQFRFALQDISELLVALAEVRLKSITYNTGVSFVEAAKIPALLLGLKRQHQAKLSILVHDYFSVCPSHFLLNSDGKFCNIPNLDACRKCLPRNPHGFTSFFLGDVAEWRELWGPLLQHADEIVAFSASSAGLLRKAYEDWPEGKNWLRGRTIEVRPHQIHHTDQKPLKLEQTERLVIGIVGQISFHKGSQRIQDLSRYIEREGASERIFIIGNLEGRVNPDYVQQTGPYKREDLAKEILKAGANVFLLPSICPETFSYVTQELMELDVPLACFNYGAPAERIKNYNKGLVLSSEDPEKVLKGLRKLFQDTHHSPVAKEV